MNIPEISPELAEEAGWHIGDGSMNFYKNYGKLKGIYQLRGHIEDDKEHYLIRIKPFFKSLYGIDVSLREMPSTRVFGFQIWNNELVEFKKKLGLSLGRKLNISIPAVFLKDDILVASVLRGIFDTDGGIYLENKNNKLYPRLEIRTISLKLANQLQYNFNNLGLRATMHSELFNKKVNRQKTYVISIRGEEMFHNFIKTIKPANPKHMSKYRKFLDSKSL
ncbi:MAG: LAGLIDADG family homing endonuclease [Candidatus Pacearchaeota archaeon]